MRKINLILLLLSINIVTSAQNYTSSIDTLQMRADRSDEIIYSYQGLLIENVKYLGSLKTYQFDIKNVLLVSKDAKKKYSNYNFKNYRFVYEIEIYALVVLNDKLLKTQKKKDELAKYKQSDIKKIYSIGRLKARRKYGWKIGRKGALIIKTK